MDVRSPLFQSIATLLIGVLFLNPILSTAAELAVDATAAGNTSLGQAGNGVPIVNIATPNGSGLSHNSFSDYNVGQQGLILNNASDKTQATQLGGLIVGNPNLKGQAAGTILNEVTGGNASQLKGYTEVAGQGAHVVVANPHGISCDGCGFINTPRATLTTGKPIVENGRLDRFDVDGGLISIEGAGLNASNLDQFDLITRSAKLNAELYANQLNVITGRNEVKAGDLSVSAKADDGSAQPQLAIDSSALGGMYAGAIRLVGTEQGVGVKLAGNLAASGGDIQIDANGHLSLAQTAASGNVRIKAASAELTGKTYAAGSINAQTTAELANRQSLAAAGRIELQGGQVVNQGVIEAGVNPNNSRNEQGDVVISGQSLRNSGSVIANRQLSVQVAQSLDNQGGTLSGKAQAEIGAAALDNRNGRVLSAGGLKVTATRLDNRQGGLVGSKADLSVAVSETLDNRDSGTLVADGKLKLDAAQLHNGAQGRVAAKGDLAVEVGSLHQQGGELISQGKLLLKAAAVDNSQGGLIAANQGLDLSVTQTLNNSAAEISTRGQAIVRMATGVLSNNAGKLIGDQGLELTVQRLLNQAEGVLAGRDRLVLKGGSLDNSGGSLSSQQLLDIDLTGQLDNHDQGTLLSAGSLKAKAARLDNDGGSLTATGRLELDTDELHNAKGQVSSQGDLAVEVGVLSQQGGKLLSQGTLLLKADTVDNSQGGLIAANQGLDLSVSQALNNSAAEISTRGQAILHLEQGVLTNSAGKLIASQDLRLTVQRLLNNAKGQLSAGQALTLVADSLDNSGQGTLVSQGGLTATLTGKLDNHDEGALISQGALRVEAKEIDNSQAGLLSSKTTLDITQAAVNNQGGRILADAALSLKGQSLDNSRGGLVSGKADLTVAVSETLDNSDSGTLVADGKLKLDAAQLHNGAKGQVAAKGDLAVAVGSLSQQGGELISQGKLLLKANAVDNSQGGLIAANQGLDLSVTQTLNNSAAEISTRSQAIVRMATGVLSNNAGKLIADQGLELTVQRLLNQAEGVLAGRDRLVLKGGSLDNSGGTLSSQQALNVELSGELDNHDQGTLISEGILTVEADSLINTQGGVLSSAGPLDLKSAALDNQGGKLISDDRLSITGKSLDNSHAGLISAAGALSIGTGELNNHHQGLITGGAGLSLNATQVNNHDQGRVAAKGAIQATLSGLDQHNKGELVSQTALSLDLQNGTLNNRDAGLLATPGALLLTHIARIDNSQGGELSSDQGFTLKATELDNRGGRIISGQALELQITQALLNNLKGVLSAAKLSATAASLDNSAGGILASKGDLDVTLSGKLDNHAEGVLSAAKALTLDSGALDNSGKGLLASGGKLRLTTGAADNSQGGVIASQGVLEASSADLNNQGGVLSSQQALTLTAGQVDNRADGLITSAAGLTLSATSLDSSSLGVQGGGEVSAQQDLSLTVEQLIQRQGRLIGEAGVQLDLKNGDLDNRGGLIAARGPLTLSNLRKLDNRDKGELSSSQGYSLNAAEIDNGEQGRLISAGTLTLNLGTGSLRNASGGLVSGWQGLTLAAGNLDNRDAGTLSSRDGALTVELSGALNNSNEGALVSQGTLSVTAASLDNSGNGILSTEADLGLTIGGKLDNHGGGVIDSGGKLEGSAFEWNNQAGQVSAQHSLLFTGTSLDNSGGQLSSAGALTLTLLGALSNASQAQLASGGPLLLKAASVDNRDGQLISQGLLSIHSGTLNNSGKGTIASRDALTLTLSGALNNSQQGLLHSQSGQLDLKAQSLNNHDGVLHSQGDLVLSLDGELNNQSGRIQSQTGNLDLQKSTGVDNRVGVLSSLTGWLKLLSGGLFDNAGGITQAQALDIQADQGVDNRGGHLSALAGDTRITAPDATFNNQGGGLYAQQSLKVSAGDFNNQGAAQGQGGKVAAGSIDFGLSGVLNNPFGILESDGSLQLVASGIDNRNGSLRALGQSGTTQLTSAGLLNNSAGAIETANTHFMLDVGNLQNAAGKILHIGAGVFGITTANVTQAGGSLITNGLLNISADSWSNSSLLQAGQLVLDIGTFTQTASGQLLAARSLTGTGNTWINDGLLASDGSLSLTLSGGYSGNGRLSSLGDLSLSAASIDLPTAASITGGGLTDVASSGLLSNRGKLTSAADLTVRAATLNNYATLGSAQKLSLYAPTLLNENGLIFSGEDMALRVNDFTNRYADVYSLGGIDVALDDQGNWSSSLNNLSGTLESVGSFSLRAALIDNRRDVLAVNDAGLYTAKIEEAICVEPGVDCSGKSNTWFKVTERNKLEVTEASAVSAILAGSSLNIAGGTLNNQSSSISAGGNMALELANLNNQGLEVGEEESSRVFRLTRMDRKYQLAYVRQAEDFTAKYWLESPGYDPNNIGDLSQSLADFLAQEFDLELVNLATRTELGSGDQSYAAIIQAGGNVSIDASNRIDNGVIRPYFTYVSGGQKVGSTATGATGVSTLVSLNAQLPPDLQQQQVNPLSLPGFSLPQGQNGLFRLSGQTGQSAAASTAQIAVGDRSLAGRSIALDSREQHLGAVDTQGRSFAIDTQGGQVAGALNGSVWSLDGDTPGAIAQGSSVALNPQAPVTENLPQVQGLPGSSVQPKPHKYLIETNPELTNLKQFLSSDYLLGNLGITPDNTQKRLGDGLYEQRLVREAIVARTGQRFIDGLTSDEALFRYLMDNAIAYKGPLNLSVGVSLSAAQVAALTHDIVWLEEHEVNGEKVLVPVLYLAQANNRLAPNGALIQGRDVALISGGELKNAGTLRAANNLSAMANGIDNSGLLEAGNRLELLATNSIRNAQGGIIVGRDVSLTTVVGDVLNERSITRHQSATGSSESLRDFADSAARIEAANSLSISAGRDVANLGGVLQSRGDLHIDAGRDVSLVSVEQRTAQSNGSRYRHEQITQLGSEVSAGRDLQVNAGRDLTALASQIEARRDVALTAGGDVTLAAAANELHDYSKTKKVTRQQDQVEQVSTELKAGGDLLIDAGQNLTLLASKASAGGEAYLVAGDNLALLSADDSSYSLYDMKKKGSWGSKKTQRDEVTDVKAIGSEIKTGGDLTLVSEGDQLYQGAKLESGNDLTLDSGGAITFEAVKDLKQESHEKSESDLAWNSMKGKGTTDETLRQSQLIAQGEIAIHAVDGLKIDIKHIDQKTVSQTIDAMVAADPQLAWIKEAEQRGDVDWRRVKELHDSFKYSHSSLGQGAMLVIVIIVAVLTAGAGSALAGAGTATGAAAGGAAAGGAAAGGAAAAGAATASASAWTVAGYAAADAAYTAVVTQGVVSTINNKGNLGAALKEVTSSDSLKNYAVAGITAGLTAGVYDKWTGTETGTTAAAGSGARAGNNLLQNGGKMIPSGGLSSWPGVGQFATNQVLQNSTSALLNKALGQGGSLGSAMQSSLVNAFAAAGFNLVGDIGYQSGLETGGAAMVGMHALMGGLAAEAAGGDFVTGALAAGANEALVASLDKQFHGMPEDKKNNLLVMNSQLVGVLAAATQSDADAQSLQTGAWVAQNGTQYNYLSHKDVADLAEKAKTCEAQGTCEELSAEVKARDQANHERLMACRKTGNCAELRAEIDAGSNAVNSLVGQLPDGQASDILMKLTGMGGGNTADWTLAGQLHLDQTANMWLADDPNWVASVGQYLDQSLRFPLKIFINFK